MSDLDCFEKLKTIIFELIKKRDKKKEELKAKKNDLNFILEKLEILQKRKKILLSKMETHEKLKKDTEKMLIQSENVYNKLYSNSEKLYLNLKKITNNK